jgi:hypothetical protein
MDFSGNSAANYIIVFPTNKINVVVTIAGLL